MKSLVCLEEREWWNLCERGFVRLLVSRIVQCQEALEDVFALDRLFAVAPNVRLESSDNLVVVVLRTDWRIRALSRPEAQSGDLVDLPASSVESFHPIQDKDRALLLANLPSEVFQLGEPIFKEAWEHWLVTESVRTRGRAGWEMADMLGLPIDWEDDVQRSRWERLALQMMRPKSTSPRSDQLAEQFLKLADTVFKHAEEDHDSMAFSISAPVEWVKAHLGVDLESKWPDLYSRLEAAWRSLRERSTSLDSEDSGAAHDASLGKEDSQEEANLVLRDLRAEFPGAFSEEITPQSVSVFLRTYHHTKSKVASPREIYDAIARVKQGSGLAAARLVSFLLGAELGPEMVRQFRQLGLLATVAARSDRPTIDVAFANPGDEVRVTDPAASSVGTEAATLSIDDGGLSKSQCLVPPVRSQG